MTGKRQYRLQNAIIFLFLPYFVFRKTNLKCIFLLNKNVLKVNFERLHWQKHKINIFSSLETNAALFFTLEKNKSSETK